MTTPIQLTGTLTGKVEDAATTNSITADGFVTDTIPNRGPNDTILLSLEGESTSSATSVVSTYGGLVFTPNAVDAPTLGTWTYYLNPTAAETIALGANPPPTTETFTLTYITRGDDGSETNRYEATIVVTIAGKDDPVQSIRYVNPTDDTADISIDEDASTGDIVGEVVITDTDTEVDDSNGNSDVPAFTITAISYVDENGDTQSFTGESPFGFDEATGNIIVVGDLDYETINQYTLTITATDATDTSIVTPPVTVTIEIGNALEINNNVSFAPIFINENDTSLSFTVTPVEARFESSPFPWITDPVKVGLFIASTVEETVFLLLTGQAASSH